MCGIIAALLGDTTQNCIGDLYEGLGILQHRGQDAAGVVTNGARGRLYQCKANGMVRDVFSPDQLAKLIGHAGIGHVRYPTAGTASLAEAQPFYVNSPYGIVLAHNGNLTNAGELRKQLDVIAHRHINTDSDSELLLNVFADQLNQAGKVRVNADDVFEAITKTMRQCRGGFACVAMIAGFGIIGFRDPNGIRPICWGRRRCGTKAKEDDAWDYMFASESVVLSSLNYGEIEELKPGEAIIITRDQVTRRQCVPVLNFAPCIFEYVYFARPDSIMNGISIYKARLAMGEALARQVKSELGEKMDIDVVIPVPDTSRVAALQLSYVLNITYREGFMKNRYVGRTFIMPGQTLRKKSVRRKLNPMPMEFAGKNVLLVDDSVVRGTTSMEIVQMARDCGARKVYFASCAPPIRYPNIYGIDMPSSQELVAFNRTTEEVAEEIGADRLIYQNLPDLIESCRKFNPSITEFDVSVFDGQYITKDVDANYFAELERQRHNRTGGVADNGMSTCASSIENGPESPTISTVPLNAMKQFGEEFGSNSTCDSPVAASPARPDAETMGLHNNFSGHTSNN